MKRKDFLKRLGLISAAVATAPVLASEMLKDDKPKYAGKEASKHIDNAICAKGSGKVKGVYLMKPIKTRLIFEDRYQNFWEVKKGEFIKLETNESN